MSITFCIHAHHPDEDDALHSEHAPELNVHNAGGWTLLIALRIEPDHYGTIDATDLLHRIDTATHRPGTDKATTAHLASRLPELHAVAAAAQRLGRRWHRVVAASSSGPATSLPPPRAPADGAAAHFGRARADAAPSPGAGQAPSAFSGGKLGPMLDPTTAPLDELDRELARLVRQYRTASHLVGAGHRPDAIDDATFQWWVTAHRTRWARRTEEHSAPIAASTVQDVELRKARLRKPSH